MIKAGDADGELAGAINATGDVLRPALQIVKTTPGISCVSGIFMMFLPNNTYGENGLSSLLTAPSCPILRLKSWHRSQYPQLNPLALSLT